MASPMSSKRRLISLLPQSNQTPDLTTFFGATVDEVFQPGTLEPISGFIGHTTPGSTDFYVGEPSNTRAFYQLEPGMVSYDPTDQASVAYALTYPDLVAYLTVNGANMLDHQRVFETDYYAWAPPINIDMLINYRHYYWFGSVAGGEIGYGWNPVDHSDNISLSNRFLSTTSSGANGKPAAVRSTPLPDGLWYVEFTINSNRGFQWCGLANTLDPIAGSPGELSSGNNALIYQNNGNVFNDTGEVIAQLLPYGPPYTVSQSPDIVALAWSTINRKAWFRLNNGSWDNVSDNPTTSTGGFDITTLLVNGQACLLWTGTNSICEATVNFGDSAFVYTPPLDFVGPATVLPSVEQPIVSLDVPITLFTGDGVTTRFALPESCLAVPLASEAPAAYVNNVNVSATVSGANLVLTIPPALGTTVLTCRTPDLAAIIVGQNTVTVTDLNTQGIDVLTSSMRIQITDAAHLTDGWDVRPWDSHVNGDPGTGGAWDASDDSNYMVDGIGNGLRLTPYSSILRGISAQYVTIDRSSIGRLPDGSNGWASSNSWAHIDSFAWSGQRFPDRQASAPIIEFIRDINLYPAQTWAESIDPLFMLYDLDHTPFNDPGMYINSNFYGNRIFGYAAGSGPINPVLLRALSYDSNGYIMFSNDAANVGYTFNLGSTTPVRTPIPGLVKYTTLNPDTSVNYHTLWRLAAQTTMQDISFGVGYTAYNIPANLQANPDYEDVDLISRSTWTAHFDSIVANQVGLIGSATGDNNYRDTARDLSLGTAIVQHHAPMLKLMLLASHSAFDLLRSIRYTELEYNRFRNKFVRKLLDLNNRGVVQLTDPPSTWVSVALAALTIGHTVAFPFAYSYVGGAQYFIPPTPSNLGLFPACVPRYLVDTTTGAAITMIQGHDGSLTPILGDFRDDILLALETLIYTNFPPSFQSEDRPPFDIQPWVGGCFYTPSKGYSRAEVVAVLMPMFELWAQINRLDYRSNTTYDAGDPFTWNFRDVLDVFGNPLPGNWRAIYRYYYDSDSPHTRPWEMLGFAGQPAWWVGLYGSAPYTTANTAMWNDIQSGTIQMGDRAGVDLRYARPGLNNLLPVDGAGDLLNPVAIGIVPTTVTRDMGSRPWQSGDGGPVEHLWWYSPSARFGWAQASFLLKPARFVEQGWDTLNIGYVGDQWVETVADAVPYASLWTRPRTALQYVHSEFNPTATPPSVMIIAGISQWIADYLLSTGQTASVFGSAVRNLGVALIHPMAGFVSSSDVELVADSFGLLPNEDVKTMLYTSPAVDSEVYSGVIITWTGASWSIIGYDARSPFFTIIPPNVTGPRGLISLATASEPAIVVWASGTYYPVAILVDYQNSVYQCKRSHTSGINFELNFWTPRPDLATSMIRAPRVVTYGTGLNTTVLVPYGTEYTSYQDIADFLLGWERWLISRGWSFTSVEVGTNTILNWSMAVTEFLTWAQVQWAPGNFIALSPGQQRLQFVAAQGTILNVEDNVTGFYGLINRSGQPISQRDAVISRLDGQITLAARNADIFLARLNVCNIEHALVVSNVTILGDSVYLPLFDLRQERLRLLTDRAIGWVGRLDAPGFIINGNTLASSFEQAANDMRYMFDIERAEVSILRDYARHNIGFQQRSYLADLLMSDNTQLEFYQGMIQEKGTIGVFQKLTRSSLVSDQSTIQFLEEWAFRLSVFGAPLDPFVTFQLIQSQVPNDPQFISFVSYAASVLTNIATINLLPNDTRWYDKPADPQFFIEQPDYPPAILPTAGPVRQSEVGNAVLNSSDVAGIYDPNTNSLPIGSLVWIYDSPPVFFGTQWYVNAVIGNDNNDGTSIGLPFATLQRAHDVSNPGDIITVAAGTYTAGAGTNVLEITRSGTAWAPILYQAVPGATPLIQIFAENAAYAGVHFNAVSYVTLQGFEIAGWNDSLILSNVQTETSGQYSSALYNGCGVLVDLGSSSNIPHHITISDCIVHDFPNSGVQVLWADYVTVQRCTVYANALYSPTAGSGINVLNSHGIDNVSSYKTVIQQNICYDNINLILNQSSTNITDGNGIAVAGNQGNRTDGVAYNGRTLVANNLCYNNGGAAVLVSNSNHVDVIFNTGYLNQTHTNHAFGECVAFSAIDCNIFNNIMVANATSPLATNTNNITTYYGNNIGNGGNGLPISGVTSYSDPLFIDPTAPARNFRVRRGSPALDAASPQFNIGMDLADNLRTHASGFDIGCYQTDAAQPPVQGVHPYSVLRVFDVASHPTGILVVTTPTENNALTSTRISFQLPLTMSSADVGNYLLIDGAALTSPEIQGIQLITAVNLDSNSVDIQSVGSKGNNFLNNLASAPLVRVLRSVRFNSIDTINPNYIFNVGDLIWLDNYDAKPQWAVMQWTGIEWALYRLQPHRIDPSTIGETVIYSAGANIVANEMFLNQPLIDDIVVIDPMAGLICDISEREIDIKAAFDPARYNAGSGTLSAGIWGPNEIGRVWWNLATVRFLEPYTDVLGVNASRDLAELQYRIGSWTHIAPGTSVDVYEWTESLVDPITYTGNTMLPGTVYNADAPAWVERSIFNVVTQTTITLFYFWVSGLTIVPNLPFRNTAVATVALGIENPSALNLAWMGALCPSGLIVSGVANQLNETTSVMKIRLIVKPENVGRHDEWLLMRPDDETSLPPNFLWAKMTDGLAGFAVTDPAQVLNKLVAIPDPDLPLARMTGIDDGQSMFQVSGAAIAAWVPGATYFYGDQVSNNGHAYQCVLTGISAGIPYLLLSNGLTASYIAGSGSPTLNFVYVGNYTGLSIVSLVLNGGTILDRLGVDGNAASLIGATNTISSSSNVITTLSLQFGLTPSLNPVPTPTPIPGVPSVVKFYVTLGTGPAGFSTTIADGTVVWAYHGTDGSRSGLLDAREAFVGSINHILAQTAVRIDRLALLDTLYRTTPVNSYLVWAQIDPSYAYEPPPNNEWDAGLSLTAFTTNLDALSDTLFASFQTLPMPQPVPPSLTSALSALTTQMLSLYTTSWEVHTLSQRNDLLANPVFFNAIEAYQGLGDFYASWTTELQAVQTIQGVSLTPILVAPPNLIPYIPVLLNGYANSVPQWSIWRFDPLAGSRVLQEHPFPLPPDCALIAFADLVFTLRTAYDHAPFATDADANDYAFPSFPNPPSLIQDGDRLLILDSNSTGFWAIVRYSAVTGNFTTWRVQTYDTSTFIELADWYDVTTLTANNYSVASPPIIVYSTETVRDETEGSSPTNLLVKIANAGSDFLWTAFINGVWQTVAIGQGTVQLSASFYDPLRVLIHAVSTGPVVAPLTLSDVGLRDGSWELRILCQAMRFTGVLFESEINQLWFNIVNFVHVQQNEVDWAFKTSFMTLAGVGVPLIQTPILTVDQTPNVIDYINEVKPYRTKIREYTTQYAPELDIASTTVTDFDDPLYVDPLTGVSRPLDPTNPHDIAILQTAPWAEWYANYTDVPSPVRMFLITLLFDRLSAATGNWDMSAWDIVSWDGGEGDTNAAYRLLTFYAPSPGMVGYTSYNQHGVISADDLSTLLGLAEKENQINSTFLSTYDLIDDGGTFLTEPIALDINPPSPSEPGGFDLRDPYFAANSPEERVPFGADDGLVITVTAQPLAGGPSQLIKVFDVGSLLGGATTLFFDLLPSSASAVLVYANGVRAVQGTDYTVNHFARSITINLVVNGSPVTRVAIHSFGFGGNSAVIEQDNLSYGINPLTLQTAASAANMVVVVNGTPLLASGFAVSGATVTLTAPPASGSDVALAVYATPSTATLCYVQTLSYTVSQVWTLANPDTATVPPHAGTIVEVNGLRLAPPTTYYGNFTVGSPWMYLPIMPDVTAAVSVYVNGVLYPATIPICTNTSPSSPYPFNLLLPGAAPSTLLAGQFVLFANLLVALDPTFVSSNVVITMQFAGSPPDYTVTTGGVLTINPTLASNALIVATTFSNAACMGIQTVTFEVNDTEQDIVPQPWAASYALVTMNGKAIVPEDDYSLVVTPFETGNVYFSAPVMVIANPTAGTVVAMMFTGRPVREPMMWMYTTTTPAFIRMYPAVVPPEIIPPIEVGWDAVTWDSQAYDDAQVKGVPTHGAQNLLPQYSITDRFESIRLSPYNAGTLVADLGIADASFRVALFVTPIAVKLQEDNPLPLPDTSRRRPGVVWIEGERIEYFGYSRVGDIVTLSLLRRATRGTSMGAKRLILTDIGDGTLHTYNFSEAGIVDVSFDGVTQPPSAFSVGLAVTLAGTVSRGNAGTELAVTVSPKFATISGIVGAGLAGHPQVGAQPSIVLAAPSIGPVPSSGTMVSLTVPVGVYVVIGLSISASHLAGTDVWHGKQIFLEDIPLGPLCGNREIQPINRIING